MPAQARERALGCLSDKLREVTDREECNVAEIAARLGVSGGTVKSRLFRARAHLIDEIRAPNSPADPQPAAQIDPAGPCS